jgi:menaquinone C8-methyltransferase
MMKHKVVRLSLLLTIFGLAAFLWATEYLRHHFSSRHSSWRIPFQLLRHSSLAKSARQGIYYLANGKEGYPFVFRRVEKGEDLPHSTSPNLYIHIPFCRSICPHCPYNKVIFRQTSYDAYGKALERELLCYLAQEGIPPIETLYFGGGTPSMTPELIQQAITLTQARFAENVEIGVEVHPRDATPERLEQLKAYGVDRISLGIETFQDALLRTLGRGYTGQQAEQAIHNAKDAGFACLDVNLIYGIPGQELQDSVADVTRCIALGVDHLSAYPLITFEHTHLGKLVREGKFNEYSDRKRAKTQKEIARVCLAHGFTRTSVWSFTKEKASTYTTVTRESYVGFGAGAGSKVDGEFWFNTFSVAEYTKLTQPRPAVRLKTTEKFRRLHWLYWQIYTTSIDIQKYEELFHRDVIKDFRLLVVVMKLLGWIKKEGSVFTLTEKGARWSHRFQMLFSLTFIDEVWTHSQREPWPKQIILY